MNTEVSANPPIVPTVPVQSVGLTDFLLGTGIFVFCVKQLLAHYLHKDREEDKLLKSLIDNLMVSNERLAQAQTENANVIRELKGEIIQLNRKLDEFLK